MIPHYTITQTGLNVQDEIDLMYMFISSLKGICAKLDDDVAVTDTDYESTIYEDYINCIVYDSRGNMTGICSHPGKDFHIVTPVGGMDDAARNAIMFQCGCALAELCDKVDTDLGTTTWTDVSAYLDKWNITTSEGLFTSGTAGLYMFTPTGTKNQKELVDMYYGIVKGIETLCEDLDASGATDTDYEALWFTANILTKVTDSTNHTAGN